MNILHINGNYMYSNLHQLLIKELNKMNSENTVFVPTYDKYKKKKDILENDRIIIKECFKKNDRFLFFYKQRKIEEALKKVCDIDLFQLSHAYTLFTDGNVSMNLKAKYGIPYVVAIRNTDVNVFLKKRIDLRKQGLKILKNASAIFFLSPSYRKQVLSKYVPYQMKFDIIQKSYVIPNGIDDYWIFNTPSKKSEEDLNRIQNKKIKVIYVGQIDKNKNIILTQKALSILRNKGYETEFTIVGKIKDRREYQHIIKYPYTRYMSFQSKESLIKLYRNNDIFIMPSHYETFGLVYAEAMSQGLPVIYTRNQGFDQQFKEGEVGYSVNDKKPDELSNKIQLICNNYKKISENSQNMSKKFKWSEIAQVYMNIYKSII